MPEAASPQRTLVVGGGELLAYAVPMESVRRLVDAADLPHPHRRVTLARLLGGAHGTPHSRYAEVLGPAPATYLELGEDVRVRQVPVDAVEPVPPFLATTARRWGWAGLLQEGSRPCVLLDVAWLASLAAERTLPTGAHP